MAICGCRPLVLLFDSDHIDFFFLVEKAGRKSAKHVLIEMAKSIKQN